MSIRIAVIVGARPEFVKVAPLVRATDARAASGVEHVLIHTGQHYDANMATVFFRELGLGLPDHDLGVGSGPHGAQTGEMMKRLEPILIDERPHAVVVFGDTNSTVAGALVAAKLHIPVAHVEAGLRSYNRAMPEEVNRVVTDHVSELLLCPSEVSRRNLEGEGIVDGVYVTGDINYDALEWAKPDDDAVEQVLAAYGLHAGAFAAATVHRAENTDDPARLHGILQALDRLADAGLPTILPLHPRTAAVLDGYQPRGVRLIDSVGHREMLALLAGARVGLTDSGGLQKELYWLGTPCVTLRDETEWVETVDVGWNVVAGTDPADIVAAAERMLDGPPAGRPQIYGDGHAADHILDVISRRIGAAVSAA